MMNTKEKILENLDGKRTEQVWELIEKVIKKIYGKKLKIPKTTKEEYFEYEDRINNERDRYIVVEDYNLNDGFYARFYGDNWTPRRMLEDYFDDDGGWEQILLVDMKEMKCYLLDKKISYSKKEVKI